MAPQLRIVKLGQRASRAAQAKTKTIPHGREIPFVRHKVYIHIFRQHVNRNFPKTFSRSYFELKINLTEKMAIYGQKHHLPAIKTKMLRLVPALPPRYRLNSRF
jgi:hypothetical protein